MRSAIKKAIKPRIASHYGLVPGPSALEAARNKALVTGLLDRSSFHFKVSLFFMVMNAFSSILRRLGHPEASRMVSKLVHCRSGDRFLVFASERTWRIVSRILQSDPAGEPRSHLNYCEFDNNVSMRSVTNRRGLDSPLSVAMEGDRILPGGRSLPIIILHIRRLSLRFT